jgi:hypothetical protein
VRNDLVFQLLKRRKQTKRKELELNDSALPTELAAELPKRYSFLTKYVANILALVKTRRHERQQRPRKDQKTNGAIRCHGRRRVKEEAACLKIRGNHCLILSQLAATLILSLVVSSI